jgi:hypothetical protein
MCILRILLTGSISIGQTLVAMAGSMEFTVNYKLLQLLDKWWYSVAVGSQF